LIEEPFARKASVQKIIDYFKHVHVTLRFSMLTIFITLFVISTLLIIIVQGFSYLRAMNFISSKLMKASARAVMEEIAEGIQPAKNEASLSAKLLETSVLSDTYDELIPYTYHLVKNIAIANAVFYADEKGNYIYTQKMKNNLIKIELFDRHVAPATHVILYMDNAGTEIQRVTSNILRYDPRVMPWYKAAKKNTVNIGTNVFLLTAPVYKKGKIQGIFGIDVTLNYISDFISKQRISQNGFSFIITKNEDMIAFPNRPPFPKIRPAAHNYVNSHKIRLPLIDKSVDIYKATGKEFQIFRYHGANYLIVYQPIPAFKKYGWLAGIVIPQNDFIGVLKKENRMTLEISLLILIIGITLVSNIISNIVKPLNLLAKETKKIRQFELDGNLVISSRIKEIAILTLGVEKMKVGLKIFQQYIPKVLVRQLIDSGENVRIGGVKKPLVIFFSDIQGFTPISEKTDPILLSQQLCEYFEILSNIILQERGTIDKYIGDSIMAFWGAPLVENKPCERAARAALNCQIVLNKMNARWQREGKPQLLTRIGIHMGEAIVGNIGSTERLSYTAIGDIINTAHHIEQLNKVYHTKILLSSMVFDVLKSEFFMRMVDYVTVKDRVEKIYLFELLGRHSYDVPFDLKAYESAFNKGFIAFQNKRWEEALANFKLCLAIYPTDTLAPFYMERCLKHDLSN
jgi:adenylate cyclase